LAADRSGRAALVDKLKREESRLREEQKKAEKERNRLNTEISRMIEKELAAERATSTGEIALTPAGKVVSEQFGKNKAQLAWPVARGVVTGKFGRQNHPTLQGIVLDNNGIDLTTDPGAAVTAVFKGTVSSIFNLPGAGSTVIVSHGAYRTVYSNLESVSVSKGATVQSGTPLGKARSVEGSGQIHFEVWLIDGANKTPQNPQQWLMKR
jgi:septal ring factor EnvC (AmiA/AmiB activator)